MHCHHETGSKPDSGRLKKLESLANYLVLDEDSRGTTELTEGTDNATSDDASSTSSDSSLRERSRIFESIKKPSGAWGTHRFEKHPWSDDCRPCVKVKEYEDFSVDEEEDEESGMLTDAIISSCLSYLERSPYDLNYVLCKCQLSFKKLKDISALMYYHYIQYLDVSFNDLTSLAALGQLPFLQHLDASHNNISALLNFKAPFYLSFVDFSYNLIDTIPDLTEFWSITHLDVSNNQITKITGLESLRYLSHLDLSYNQIVIVENLDNLRIQSLTMHHNAICDSEDNMDLKALSFLRFVDLSNNELSSLAICRDGQNLVDINMSSNNISTLLELYYLQNVRYLSRLNLSGNPLSKLNYYANVCLRTVKCLKLLDGKEITPEHLIEIKSNYEIDPLLLAGESHLNMILLEQINQPVINSHIFPCDQPTPLVVLLVGPPGSMKNETLKMICGRIKTCVVGVSHTTRPRAASEIHGEDYYFVSDEEFRHLTREGQFLAVYEFNGHSYGIMHDELKKGGERKILMFHSGLISALSLRLMGVNPRLVLAMPRSEETHLSNLKSKYFFLDTEQGVTCIRNCSDCVKHYGERSTKSSISAVTQESRSLVEELVRAAVDLKDYENTMLEGSAVLTRDSAEAEATVPVIDFDGETETVVLLKKEVPEPQWKTDSIRTAPGSLLRMPERYGTRVSFNEDTLTQYSVIKDTPGFHSCSHVSVIDDPTTKKTDRRSVSDHMISQASQTDKGSKKPNLSAMSRDQVDPDGNAETVYMQTADEFDKMQDEKLKVFFKEILESRDVFLDVHWSTPGLFREVIFTDELEESFAKMKAFLKLQVENYKLEKPLVTMKDDRSYQRIVSSRLKQLDLQRTADFNLDEHRVKCSCDMQNMI